MLRDEQGGAQSLWIRTVEFEVEVSRTEEVAKDVRLM